MLDTALIDAIKSHNPFDRSFVVRKDDIWQTGFPDVPSLNSHASDAIFEAIEKVHTRQKSVIGITITAERGVGKSHIISRIRRQLQADASALFVYVSEINDLNRIQAEFLRNLATSLKQVGSQGVSQWRELATALFNEAYRKDYTPEQLVAHLADVITLNPHVIEHWTDKVLEIKPDLENPEIITAILWTLSKPSQASFAINWLSGQELAKTRADALGLSNSNPEDREAQAFTTTRQIIDLISNYKPIVICFDELESAQCNDAGYTGRQVAALFAKDLYDQIKRGVILTAMYPTTWNQEIRTLSQAEAVVDRIGENIIELKHLNSDDVISLVSFWMRDFFEHHHLTSHVNNPLYPFDPEKLRQLGKERPPIRQVLNWCKENFYLSSETTASDKHPVESAYNKEIEALKNTIQDEIAVKETLVGALRLGFSSLIGQKLENLQIDEIANVKAKSIDQGYINFKIIGKQGGNEVKIGVSVLEGVTGRFLQAALKRLADYKTFDLTCGCIVRSKKVNSATKAKEYLDKLLSPPLDGRSALLKTEDIKPLLAINSVMRARKDYELSLEQIIDFIVKERLALDNNLIHSILKASSDKISDTAVDEDSES